MDAKVVWLQVETVPCDQYQEEYAAKFVVDRVLLAFLCSALVQMLERVHIPYLGPRCSAIGQGIRKEAVGELLVG